MSSHKVSECFQQLDFGGFRFTLGQSRYMWFPKTHHPKHDFAIHDIAFAEAAQASERVGAVPLKFI